VFLPEGRITEFCIVGQVLLDDSLGQTREVADTLHRVALTVSNANPQEVSDIAFHPVEGMRYNLGWEKRSRELKPSGGSWQHCQEKGRAFARRG